MDVRDGAPRSSLTSQISTAELLRSASTRLSRSLTPRSGKIPAPEAASALYNVVEAAEQVNEAGLPSQSASAAPSRT